MSQPESARADRPRHTRLLAATGVVCLIAAAGVWLLGSDGDAADTDDAAPPAVTETGSRSTPIIEPVLSMRRSVPVRMAMPSIGVHSKLVGLGLEPDGSLEVPGGAFPAGWFTGSPTPGELGPAILAGHVSYNGTDGVFADLSQALAGDTIVIRRTDGSSAVFEVTRVAHFAKAHFPSEQVYGNLDHAGLRLITCGGFNPKTATYADNVVVFADLVRAADQPEPAQ
jgi:sortase (surface protein transpeptidase)